MRGLMVHLARIPADTDLRRSMAVFPEHGQIGLPTAFRVPDVCLSRTVCPGNSMQEGGRRSSRLLSV